MSEFIGNVVVHGNANLFGRNVLKGNITIGEGVILDNVCIYGDFHITRENRLTNIVDSVLVGEGRISDCGIHDCYLVIDGDCDNFIMDGIVVHEPRTYNDVLMDGYEGINEPLEKQDNINDTNIEVE